MMAPRTTETIRRAAQAEYTYIHKVTLLSLHFCSTIQLPDTSSTTTGRSGTSGINEFGAECDCDNPGDDGNNAQPPPVGSTRALQSTYRGVQAALRNLQVLQNPFITMICPKHEDQLVPVLCTMTPNLVKGATEDVARVNR